MADTIVHRLFDQVKKRGDAPAYLVKRGGIWHATSWTDYGDEIERSARALISLGFAFGDRACILGFNRPEWVIFDLAAMMAGGAPAGIYTTCSPDEVAYILNHSESPVVLLENEEQWLKVKEKREELPHLKRVVMMKGTSIDDELVIGWDDFLALGDPDAEHEGDGEDTLEAEMRARVERLEDDQLATLIYTSGTTGPPKAVMLSHQNLAWTARILAQVASMETGGRSLSYLPLSHIAEQMASIHGPVTVGSAVYYAESIDKIADNLKDCRPVIFFGVPRIWEKFHTAIGAKLALATGPKAKLVDWARGVAVKVNELKNRGEEPAGLLALQYTIASKLVFAKLKAAVGLDEAKCLISGAAPISKEIIEFFASLDIVIQEIYGQSEDSGPTSFNLTGRTKFGSVGPALPGVEVKIADDGEIVVRGPNVFLGYFKDEKATNETLEDGWLHSGDLGRFDDEGFLHITGRKKDIIITAGGKNITPKNIESGIKNHPLVHEAVVIGDRRKYLTALISPDDEAVAKFMQENGLSGAPHESKQVHDAIWTMVEQVNAKLARVEQVKKIKVLPRALSIEDGELTPTLKVKRSKVSEHFADEIEKLYAD
ncbi:MAG: AMP-dependent synthetase/ligase [Sandaracinaceae bacterium]|nr:MAG: long-chain fatty acid--CoA ligase [Sandaracinaceae bacterium]